MDYEGQEESANEDDTKSNTAGGSTFEEYQPLKK